MALKQKSSTELVSPRHSVTFLSSRGLVSLLSLALGFAAAAAPAPKFEEIYGLLKTNAAGLTAEKLDHAILEGLADKLPGYILLGAATNVTGPSVIRTNVYEGSFGYFRVGQVTDSLTKELAATYTNSGTNALKGVVLDLRFASGVDYTAVATLADNFQTTERPLLDPGTGMRKSTAKTNAWALPTMVLVNRQTTGAAEALAAVLRQSDAALLIGANTGGAARTFKEFTLSSGETIRIGTGAVLLGDGKPLSARGIGPDISVTVPALEEKTWFEDPYKLMPGQVAASTRPGSSARAIAAANSQTNRPTRRINEAELVRMRREGLSDEETEASTGDADAPKAILRDPPLARALDLLKGLAVVRQNRQN